MENRQLNLVVDMHGCPNRCLHCWIGHMPNRTMKQDADKYIVDYFRPYFERIAYYSWLREPDFCNDYKDIWQSDIDLSINTVPQRFELASFYRIVRDKEYVPFLKDVGVEKVQLTLFGLEETQDRYVGRRGAFRELLRATDILIEEGIIPRWQCFINEENRTEILELLDMADKIRANKCPELEFFVHEGSCDGENRKLYPIRIKKSHIPRELIPYYLGYATLMTESECCNALENDMSAPCFHNDGDITLNISNTCDVYFNFTHMAKPWVIGNMHMIAADELVRRIIEEDTFAINKLNQVAWCELVKKYGNFNSEKVFQLGDFKMFLVNEYLEDIS